MTEQEWLSCGDVREMLDWLPTRRWRRLAVWLDRSCGPDQLRRFYLFAKACFARTAVATVCRGRRDLVTNELPARSDTTAEDYAAGPWKEGVCASAAVTVEAWAARWADAASRCVAWRRAYSTGHLDWVEFRRARELERGVQASLLRCIYGNPFKPTPAVDLDWLESAGQAAERLARAIAATNAFGRLPELADALADADCHDAVLLAHCREPGPHARGCWAIELLAGPDGLEDPPMPPEFSTTAAAPHDRTLAPPAPNANSFGITSLTPRSR